jgi:hypothetical protein
MTQDTTFIILPSTFESNPTLELSGCPQAAFYLSARKVDDKLAIGQSARMTCYADPAVKRLPLSR